MTEQAPTPATPPDPDPSAHLDTGSIDPRAWAAGDVGLPDQRAVPDACARVPVGLSPVRSPWSAFRRSPAMGPGGQRAFPESCDSVSGIPAKRFPGPRRDLPGWRR